MPADLNISLQSAIRDFLQNHQWVKNIEHISFLAAGEYNANYLIRTPRDRYVLRINHGSQLGLCNQIEYEYRVLQAVEASGVTPRAYACDPHPTFGQGGALLMQFLPGRPLDYSRDLGTAAWIFARIHTLDMDQEQDFVLQHDPVLDIVRECDELLHRYPDHPLHQEQALILKYRDEVGRLGEDHRQIMQEEPLCLVNTEVNSGNFLISESGESGENRQGGNYLVDWEKAVLSQRYQDLGHFLVPTTTLWKTEHILSAAQKQAFLRAYKDYANLDLTLEELGFKTTILEKTILLRALSWCYMAFFEYTRQERSLRNQTTFAKIQHYLGDIQWVLQSVG